MFDIDIDENKGKFVRSVSYRYSSGRFSQTDFKLNIFYLNQVAKQIFISYLAFLTDEIYIFYVHLKQMKVFTNI